jgi:hypothetical protein
VRWFKAKVTVEVEKQSPESSYDVLDVPDPPHDCRMPNSHELFVYGTRIICRDCSKEWILERISGGLNLPHDLSPEYKAYIAQYEQSTGKRWFKDVQTGPYPSWCEVTENYQVKTPAHWIGRSASA